MSDTVYKLKERNMTALEKLGWELAPRELRHADNVMILSKKFSAKSEPVGWIERQFNSKKWQEQFLPDFKSIYTEMGIKWRHNKVVKNNEFKEFAGQWFLIFDFNEDDELWLGLSNVDITMPDFYGSQVIDRYCEQEVEQLLQAGLIEKLELIKEEDKVVN